MKFLEKISYYIEQFEGMILVKKHGDPLFTEIISSDETTRVSSAPLECTLLYKGTEYTIVYMRYNLTIYIKTEDSCRECLIDAKTFIKFLERFD